MIVEQEKLFDVVDEIYRSFLSLKVKLDDQYINIVTVNDYLRITSSANPVMFLYKIYPKKVSNIKPMSIGIDYLRRVVNSFTGDIVITQKNNKLLFKQGKKKITCPGANVVEVNLPSKFDRKQTVSINLKKVGASLNGFVDKNIVFNTTRHINIFNSDEKVLAVGTDKYKFKIITVLNKNIDFDFLINPKISYTDVDEVDIAETQSFFIFIYDNKLIFQRKPAQQYPDIVRAISVETKEYFTFNRNSIIDSITTSKRLFKEREVKLILRVSDDIRIKTMSFSENQVVEYEDEFELIDKTVGVNVLFNSSILYDILSSVNDNIVKIKHNGMIFMYKGDDIMVGGMGMRGDY